MYDRPVVRLPPRRIIEHGRDVIKIDRKMRQKKSVLQLFFCQSHLNEKIDSNDFDESHSRGSELSGTSFVIKASSWHSVVVYL